jgi:hypothetical protein
MADITISSTGSYDLTTTLSSGTNIDFVGTGGTLTIEPAAVTSAGLGGTINNFGPGDNLVVDNIGQILTNIGDGVYAGIPPLLEGSDLVIAPGGSVTSDYPGFLFGVPTAFQTVVDDIEKDLFGSDSLSATVTFNITADPNNFGQADIGVSTSAVINGTMPCFAAGTRILTVNGEVSVEDLREGDTVITARDGAAGAKRIVWTGKRSIDIARHPNPDEIRPIRIYAGAFGPGLPQRDLRVSPHHAIYVKGVLVEAQSLINDATVVREQTTRHVTYHHIELETHDIILAEGVPVESYLETGSRNAFEDAGSLILHPDFVAKGDADFCAPMIRGGETLAAIRQLLLDRATELGFTTDASIDLELRISGEALAA